MAAWNQSSGAITPRPDYWTGLLHKKLMGQDVLKVSSSSRLLRAYAHCSEDSGVGVTLALLNIASADTTVDFAGGDFGTEHEEWVLTAGAKIPDAPNVLQSYDAELNGITLSLQAGPALPSLEGKKVSGTTVKLPPTSYAFVRFAGATSKACKVLTTEILM